MDSKYPIKNIIFDFGGVIINIDFMQSINAFIALGVKNFDTLYSKTKQSKIFDDLDIGAINPKDFCEALIRLFPKQTTMQQIVDAWNAIILDIPERRIRLLEQIRPNYRLFLLSNTNCIHYDLYTSQLEHLYGYKNLSELFDKVYLSYEEHLRKPNPQFYQMVLLENNLNPQETVFIDDSEQNLPIARQLGINTILLNQNKDVSELYECGRLIPFARPDGIVRDRDMANFNAN